MGPSRIRVCREILQKKIHMAEKGSEINQKKSYFLNMRRYKSTHRVANSMEKRISQRKKAKFPKVEIQIFHVENLPGQASIFHQRGFVSQEKRTKFSKITI